MKAEKRRVDPLYAFRLPSEDKKWLEEQLEKLKEELNQRRKAEDKKILKNDIILEALKIGFKQLKAQKK